MDCGAGGGTGVGALPAPYTCDSVVTPAVQTEAEGEIKVRPNCLEGLTK